jgi:flagellar hook-length control protein FliK
MDSIGSMNSFGDNSAAMTRVSRNAGARRSENDDQIIGSFETLLASVAMAPILPPITPQPTNVAEASEKSTELSQNSDIDAGKAPIPATPSVPQDSATSAEDKLATPAIQATPNSVTPSAPQGDAPPLPLSNTLGGKDALTAMPAQPTATSNTASQLKTVVAPAQINGSADTSFAAPTENSALTTPPQNLANAGGTVLEQMAALTSEDGSPAIAPQTHATPTNAAQPNAAITSANGSNAGVLTAQSQSAADSAPTANAQASVTSSTGPNSNDNTTLTAAPKAKAVAVEAPQTTPGQTLESAPTGVDVSGSTSSVSGQEVAVPANDQTQRAPQLTPHTIPMLAATMMRRLESGSRQFTMRLDPPELGQVEVKLTVAADKKVRAVVSADRPEALADLVRSARELTRALHEAGLDLDDGGLTFQLNDPSSGGRQQQDQSDRNERLAQIADKVIARLPSETTETDKPLSSNDPFQRWQRARIALTA